MTDTTIKKSDLPSHKEASRILSAATDCCQKWKKHRKALNRLADQLSALELRPRMMLQYAMEAYDYDRCGHCDGHIEDVEDDMHQELDSMYGDLGLAEW